MPKIANYPETICFRVTRETKRKYFRLSGNAKRSLSQFLRIQLEHKINGEDE